MFLREWELYKDANGWSEVEEQMEQISKSDVRGFRAILKRIRQVRTLPLEEALRAGIAKKPSPRIFVLRVQSGPVSAMPRR